MRHFFRDLGLAGLMLSLLLGGFVWARFEHSHRLPSRQFGLSGLAAMPRLDVVLMGSSRTRQGYDPAVFESLGCQAYVLGYNGLSPAMMPPLLQAARSAAGVARPLWVLEASTHALLRAPVLQDTRLFLQLPPRQKSDLLARLARLDPSFDSQRRLDLLLRTDNELLLSFPLVGPWLERGSYRGGVAGKRGGELDAARFAGLKLPADLAEDGVPPSGQSAALEEILQLLRDQQARHVFLEPPMPAPLAEMPANLRARQWLKSRLTEAGAAHVDGSTLIDQARPAFFADGSHLSARGRAAFTLAVAQRLAAAGMLDHCLESEARPESAAPR